MRKEVIKLFMRYTFGVGIPVSTYAMLGNIPEVLGSVILIVGFLMIGWGALGWSNK